jgi:hypothetical protein
MASASAPENNTARFRRFRGCDNWGRARPPATCLESPPPATASSGLYPPDSITRLSRVGCDLR